MRHRTENPTFLAVKCSNTGTDGGLIVSSSSGIRTDSNWKYSTEFYPGWNLWSHDEMYQWARPVVRANNDETEGVNYMDGFGDASWIWPSDAVADYVYFRATLGEIIISTVIIITTVTVAVVIVITIFIELPQLSKYSAYEQSILRSQSSPRRSASAFDFRPFHLLFII